MRTGVEIAPEFEDELFHFKTFFAFTDLALNDSTIQPINLALPNRRPKTQSARPEVAPPSPAPPKDGSPLGRRRFLRPQVLNNATEASQPEPVERPSPPEPDPDPEPAREEDPEPEQPVAVDQDEEPSPKQSTRVGWPPQMMEITEENMHAPIPEGFYVAVEFHIKAEKNSNWSIVDCKNNNIVFKATKSGVIGSYSVKISMVGRDAPAAVLVSNFTHSKFFAISKIEGKDLEVAALGFKMQKKNGLKTRRFRARIPQIGGEVLASDGSSLLKHKELAFNMKPKPPKMKGGIPVLYFGGRVKMQSTRNHILISKQMEGNLLVFGKASPKVFIGEFYHPLSPVQGICLSLPHFK